MIQNISTWAKNITLAVIVVSIFEMLLPNKKMKSYIKVVMGLYILFNILSPFVGKNFSIDMNQMIENTTTQMINTEPVNQTSMNQRLKQIGEEELEKDVAKTVEDLGFAVKKCEVKLEINEETTIKSINLDIETKEAETQKGEDKNMENTLIEEIQKIKKVQIGKEKNDTQSKSITSTEKNQIKKILMEEYEVKEECLKIN